MFSLKSSLRKTITVTMASVMITTVFVGCSGTTDSYATGLDVNVSTTTSITTTIADNTTNPTPGSTGVDTDFTIKYKYWYDSDYTKESQPITGTTAIDDINAEDTTKQLFGLAALPIHTDEDGNEFIMSGRRQVYLENGKLPLAELVLLRTEGESDAGGGQRVYTVEDPASTTKELEAFDSMLEANGIVPPTSIEERQTADEALTDEKTVSEGLTIFVNNLETEFTTTADGMIDISNVFSKLTTLGYLDPFNGAAENAITVCMQTAAEQVDVKFAFTDTGVKVSYTDGDKTTLAAEDIVKSDNTILFTPDALERTLGYDVEVYADAGFINIVTDQQDLVATDTLVDSDAVPKYVNVGETVESDPEADQLASEREDNIPVATTEEAEQHAQDRQDRQDMAENTDAYTTDGIPLTTRGNLTAPAKPTANYKLPDDAQLEFTGDASTALLTELPDGCYWLPGRGGSENAFMDPAGNLWLNTVTNTTTNRGEGYYSPDGTYHHSQAETDRAIALNQASQERWDNGPTNDGTSGMTEEQADALWDMLGG